jgi:lipid A 3-O-deacylase
MKVVRVIFRGWVVLLVLATLQGQSWGQDSVEGEVLTRFGFGLSYGNSFHPDNNIGFLMANYVALFDYDKIWKHSAPKALRFKLELSLGSTTTPKQWVMASTGMMALYYLDPLSTSCFRPYVEAGIGFIYTGFAVEGQGSHLNFNPRAGIGAEFPLDKEILFTSLRWDHLSNAGLNEDNTSVDSVILMFGAYF